MNPWEKISLFDYEEHMKSENVMQLQALSEIMKSQLKAFNSEKVMILGVAGGNGLSNVEIGQFRKIYGVDINGAYLEACKEKYEALSGIFEPVCADLTDDEVNLPKSDFVIADLLIEYIGCNAFKKAIVKVAAKYVSCVIIDTSNASFVSNTPYSSALSGLEEIARSIDLNELTDTMNSIGFKLVKSDDIEILGGKKLIRLDFCYRG